MQTKVASLMCCKVTSLHMYVSNMLQTLCCVVKLNVRLGCTAELFVADWYEQTRVALGWGSQTYFQRTAE